MDDNERLEGIRSRFAELTGLFEDMAADAVRGQGTLPATDMATLAAELVNRSQQAITLLGAIAKLAARG